jgi:hypothetical protein
MPWLSHRASLWFAGTTRSPQLPRCPIPIGMLENPKGVPIPALL